MLIAYLHGFLSGPNALKAQIFRRILKERYPQYDFLSLDFPDTPKEALAILKDFCQNYSPDNLALVGSSMGGFMATVLNGLYGFKAALINPCVHPQDFCDKLLGAQYNSSTDTHFTLTLEMIKLLAQLDVQARQTFKPESLYVLLQTGDEVLDYTKSLSFYQGCKIDVFAGGNHAFVDFDAVVPQIVDFLTKKE